MTCLSEDGGVPRGGPACAPAAEPAEPQAGPAAPTHAQAQTPGDRGGSAAAGAEAAHGAAAAKPPANPPPLSAFASAEACLDAMAARLAAHDAEGFFKAPVTDDIAPGYSSIIARPMDLATMRRKLADGEYAHWNHVVEDFDLMCANALAYNDKKSYVHRAALNMQRNGKRTLQTWELQARKALAVQAERRGVEWRPPARPPPRVVAKALLPTAPAPASACVPQTKAEPVKDDPAPPPTSTSPKPRAPKHEPEQPPREGEAPPQPQPQPQPQPPTTATTPAPAPAPPQHAQLPGRQSARQRRAPTAMALYDVAHHPLLGKDTRRPPKENGDNASAAPPTTKKREPATKPPAQPKAAEPAAPPPVEPLHPRHDPDALERDLRPLLARLEADFPPPEQPPPPTPTADEIATQADAILETVAVLESAIAAVSPYAVQAVANADVIADKEAERAARAAAQAQAAAARAAAREAKALAAKQRAAAQAAKAAKGATPPSTSAVTCATSVAAGAALVSPGARRKKRDADLGDIVMAGSALGGGPTRIESIRAVDIVTPGVRTVDDPDERIKRFRMSSCVPPLDDAFYERLHAPHERAERERYSAAIAGGRRGAAGGGGAAPPDPSGAPSSGP